MSTARKSPGTQRVSQEFSLKVSQATQVLKERYESIRSDWEFITEDNWEDGVQRSIAKATREVLTETKRLSSHGYRSLEVTWDTVVQTDAQSARTIVSWLIEGKQGPEGVTEWVKESQTKKDDWTTF